MSEVGANSVAENYDWLTESLFEPIIEKEFSELNKSDYVFNLSSIKPAVGKGENYISLVTRVQLDVKFSDTLDREPKTYHFIVKSSILMIKELEEMGVFEKEMAYYENIAQNFLKFDDTIQFLPTCYASTVHDRKIIIMNDLSECGYKMQDRLLGLDLAHCKLFYKTIGQYHALGAAYYEKHGRFDEQFHKSNYRLEMKEMIDKWSAPLYEEFLKIFDRYDSLRSYREYFHKWQDKIYVAMCEVAREKLDEFNVLNHGDAWVNNMLFRHDADNAPTDLCFIDFQISVYGTPITDIMYFFVTSPNLEVREHGFDELLQIYHTSLTENLQNYEYPKPIPTLRELQMAVLKYGLMAAYFMMGITPIVLLNSEDTRPADVFAKEDEEGNTFRYNLYNSPRYIKVLEVALKYFERHGLLDI